MIKERLVLVNPLGLHARAAAKFVGVAKTFESLVTITRGEQAVDGKSIMKVLLLAAPVGTELELTVEGADEETAAAELAALVAEGFGELED